MRVVCTIRDTGGIFMAVVGVGTGAHHIFRLGDEVDQAGGERAAIVRNPLARPGNDLRSYGNDYGSVWYGQRMYC